MLDFYIFNLYQPLSQFEATLYNTSYIYWSGFSSESIVLFFKNYLLTVNFYFDIIYYFCFLWLIDLYNQDTNEIANSIMSSNPTNFGTIIFVQYLVVLSELSNIFHVALMGFTKGFISSFFIRDGVHSFYEFVFINLASSASKLVSPLTFFTKPDLYSGSYLLEWEGLGGFILVIGCFYIYAFSFIYHLFNYFIFVFIFKLYCFLGFFSSYFSIHSAGQLDLYSNSTDITILDTSITKFHVASLFILLYFLLFLVFCFKNPKYYFRNWNIVLFGLLDGFLSNTIVQQLGVKRGQKYSVFLKSLFFLIMFGNVFGLIPFSFTITSHLIYTFALSLSILLGITILALYLQGFGFFKLFVPSGAPAALLVLLVPIEIISYVARCFSLAIRLFANMMSGHTLLNILSGFVIKMAANGLLIIALAPFAVVMAVSVLEMGIAFLQAYVFVVLVCIYLKDGFEAGH